MCAEGEEKRNILENVPESKSFSVNEFLDTELLGELQEFLIFHKAFKQNLHVFGYILVFFVTSKAYHFSASLQAF